jgi:CubicO group peptidase (beta-lactamase class C family)
MRAMSGCGVGPPRVVAFHPDGGYAVAAGAHPRGRPQPPLLAGHQRFSIDQFAANLRDHFDGKVVKYAFMVRYGSAVRAWAAGPKRTATNPPAQDFTVYDWFNPASVTKTITAVVVLRLLQDKGLTIDEPIHPYLPSTWSVPDSVKTITVRELLSHTSGFREGGYTYDELAELVEKGIELSDKVFDYQNTNYALARIVAAYLNGHREDDSDQGEATSRNFIIRTQASVFDPLGIPGVQWKPDADDPTEFYPDPPGDSAGTSYKDWTLKPGSAGVHLSIAELSMFVDRLSETDDLLSAEMRGAMDAEGLGWGVSGTGKTLHYSKGGLFPAKKNGGAALYSRIAKFATGVQVAVVSNGGIDVSAEDLSALCDAAWQRA